jgi:hypothetical protein
MTSDKATSFDTSGSTEWEGVGLLAEQKCKLRKSEPFHEQY